MTLLLVVMATMTAWATQPDRYLDKCIGGCRSILVGGWAYDPDASSQSIDVHVYVYTDAGCTNRYGNINIIKADVSRPDVNSAKGITGNHGFDAVIPINQLGDFWVKVFAIDTNGDGNPQIGNTTKVTVKEAVTLPDNKNYTAQDGEMLTGTTSKTLTIAAGARISLNYATINDGIVCEGTATITLVGTNSVKGTSDFTPGIQPGGAGTTLTIQGDGSLTTTGTDLAAGIGTGYNERICGDIVILGGNITAKGGLSGTGIGTGYSRCTCGNITISGGVVNAIGGKFAASIGSGYYECTCGDIIISGGVVNATGGSDVSAAGIGSGYSSSCRDIIISGGVVTATGEEYAAGIGTGYNGTCGDITITDGVSSLVAVKGEESPKSIGCGKSGTCGTVTIGGTICPDGIATSPYLFPERHISLDDGTAYTQTKDSFVSTATYTKTLNESCVNKHQAWLVPFDYTIKSNDLEHFTFYEINMIANSPSPDVEASEEMWVFLTRLDAGAVLHANMPYVYKPREAVTDYVFTTEFATMKPRNDGVIAETQTMKDIYSFYATYSETTATEDNPFYYVSITGDLNLGTDVTVGPYRWIIRKTSKFGDTPSYAPEMRFFDGEEDADGIRPPSISPEGEGTQAFPREGLDGAAYYNLAGQRLNKMQRGINIVNGKKILK